MFDGKSNRTEHIRQICRRLRPILGPRIDEVFAAYCAEDPEGKQQLETYLEMLSAKYLVQGLDDSEPGLIPPAATQAHGKYPIGQVNYCGKNLYEFGLRENEWIQHMAILGRSGSGKTNIGFSILRTLVQHQKPFLVFDWKRNYRDLLTWPQFRDVEVYTIGRNIAPLTFNPLIPPAGTDPKTWLKKLNEVIAHAYCLGNGVLFLLQQAVDAVYEDAGVYEDLVNGWPTFKDVLLKARNMDTRGRESGWLSSTLRALSSLCFGGMGDLLNSASNTSIDHVLDGNVILELDGLSQADKTFFVQACLLYLHHKKMAENVRERFDRCILIEEAHHILSGQRTSLTGAESVMDTTYREIREFGVSLVLLDQMPSKLSGFALANSYTTICMSMSNRADINAMTQTLLLDSGKDILGTLEVGQAVVKLQGRIQRPFLISIPEFNIRKGQVTDAQIRQYMRQKTVQLDFEDEATKDEAAEGAGPHQDHPESSSSRLEIALLQDVVDHPDSGVAARYKRLGLSARQGHKLKTKLLEQGMIQEQLETTHAGRQMTVRLTEKGEQMLSHARKAAPG
ncbi:helicase HerA domain-containing protein [Anaerobaca lacustris]|uniref:DUF87 domain-containing protein n=1 Tax=Anaerobaca lacustris TaxID=3044600 RepID=A0AAW6U2Z3_9BACT|nr:DUF87 domain-containing protein [Sedimentisphaerales bacterium M17dextr]